MKRYSKYLMIVAALTITISSCQEDFLEYVPQDQATVGSWYRTADEVRKSTAALYGRVWWKVNDQFTWLAGDVLAGDLFHDYTDEGQFFFLSFTENNQYIGQGWQGFYNVISFANLIIDDMPSIASGYGVSSSDINKALGEARFMRGVAYFMLAEYWGEAPIIERPADKVNSGDLLLPRNTTQSLYEFARRDLVFAAENLPTSDQPGRVTSWSAKGMLAKLHVTLGQRFAGGSSLGSANDFTIAAEYAADVINNSGLVLFPNYEDMFKVDNEHNPEILFATQLINGGWGFGSSRFTRFARNIYVSGGSSAWGQGKCMSVNFIDNVADNAEGEIDNRRKAIYMDLNDHYDYIAKAEGGYTYHIESKDEKGNVKESATPTLTSLKKHVIGGVDDTGYAITDQDSPFDIYFLRLADVYLLYAEAMLGSGTSLSSGPGYDAYLQVRQRAGLNPPQDGNMTYEDLFNERRVEFGLESQSWLDVKRRYYRDKQDAIAYLNDQVRTKQYYRINSQDNLGDDPAGYELILPGGVRTALDADGNLQYNTNPQVVFTDLHMKLPVPSSEVVKNPLLSSEPVEYVFE